jgi:hypothetical protein
MSTWGCNIFLNLISPFYILSYLIYVSATATLSEYNLSNFVYGVF